MVSLNIYKNSANKFGRKIWLFKSNLTLKVKVNCHPKTIGTFTKLFSTSGPNLVILAWMGNELWSGQAQNGVNSDFLFNLTNTIGTLTKVFCIFGPNLAILAWTGPELSRGQASDWHTDWHTHTQTQAMTIPEGQNWPRVKTSMATLQWHHMTIIQITGDAIVYSTICSGVRQRNRSKLHATSPLWGESIGHW